MSKKQLLLKDVLKWGIDHFGYYGHLKGLAEMAGVSRGYFSVKKRRCDKWVSVAHSEIFAKASNGKLVLIDRDVK